MFPFNTNFNNLSLFNAFRILNTNILRLNINPTGDFVILAILTTCCKALSAEFSKIVILISFLLHVYIMHSDCKNIKFLSRG